MRLPGSVLRIQFAKANFAPSGYLSCFWVTGQRFLPLGMIPFLVFVHDIFRDGYAISGLSFKAVVVRDFDGFTDLLQCI